MRQITVIRFRRKDKQHQVEFEARQRYGPLGFLYLSLAADGKLGQPSAVTVTLEPVTPERTPDTAASAVTKDQDNGTVAAATAKPLG